MADGLAGPEGIDVGPDGRLYVAEVGQKRVVAIDPATGAKTVIASNLDIGLEPYPGGPPALVPTGVAVGADRRGLCQLRPPQRALQAHAARAVGAFMPGIPFIKDFKFDYGTAMEVTPLIRRVVAHNPSPFTFKGTGTYIIGHGKVAIVDPGPDMQDHIDAVLRAVRGETVTHILVTHTHIDHVPATPAMAKATGAKVYSYGPHPGRRPARRPSRRAISPSRPTSSSTTATWCTATAGTSRRSTRRATSPTISASR